MKKLLNFKIMATSIAILLILVIGIKIFTGNSHEKDNRPHKEIMAELYKVTNEEIQKECIVKKEGY
ncbi:hypothetical protein AVANS14531_00505 [Campylobacter sp. Cr9]|uniref:hypothetical protein n=1 Tax=Campylobacter sp. Cr9 TaxID=2735728 RepID=UPI003015494D|nr:hypothetical protein [Campylobacter sp. Cr9]